MTIETKTILIVTARSPLALDLARYFHTRGHRVIAADTSRLVVSRFSNSIARSYVVPSPRVGGVQFGEGVRRVAEKENVDLIIPIYEEALHLAAAREQFPASCCIFTASLDELDALHNKWRFYQKVCGYGLATPPTVLINFPDDLNRRPFERAYALKPVYCRAGLDVFKVEAGQGPPEVDINPRRLWLAQQWIEGKRYCSYSISHSGKLVAHTVYPVRYSIKEQGCLNFIAIDHPKILEWVRDFVAREGYTGQIAFDFIEQDDGTLVVIECNPRATSGIHLFNRSDGFEDAFFDRNTELVQPPKGYARQLAVGMMMYGWGCARARRNPWRYLKTLFCTEDVIFDKNDLLPFLMQPLVVAKFWRRSRGLNRTLPAAFLYDLEWNGQVNAGQDST